MSAIAPPVQPPPFANGSRKQLAATKSLSILATLRLLLTQIAKKWRFHESSNDRLSFISSLSVHTLLILIFAIVTTNLPVSIRPAISIEPDELEPVAGDMFGYEVADPDELLNEAMGLADEISQNSITLINEPTVQTLNQMDTGTPDPVVSPLAWLPTDIETASNASASAPAKLGAGGIFAASSMEGRSPENRRKLGMQNGASKESEAAVDAALEWFAKHQAVDGSWSTEMTDKPCDGRCANGTEEIGSPKRIAATGLALLCFLGAGHTHRQGPYKAEVYKAIKFLTSSIKIGPPNARDPRENGRFKHDDDRYEMYEHGIAVLAMCEAYQMTGDSILRVPVEVGIDFIERSQHSNGSWGYQPNTPGDLSIVGWQMMALKSAHQIGIKVKPDVIHRADKFLDSQQSEQGAYYGYRSTQREACTTAIGLMLRLYRGWSRTDPRIMKGTQYIFELGPSIDGIYYNYYATQLLFHMKYEKWSSWNQLSRDYLVKEQSQVGHEKGSWFFGRNHFNQVGGRLYCTAMATLTLEVYYRFMPIHNEVDVNGFTL